MEREKPTIILHSIGSGCGLIVPHPTGIVYRNSCGRASFLEPELEGFYIPLDWDIKPLRVAIQGIHFPEITRTQLLHIDKMLIHAWESKPIEEGETKQTLAPWQMKLDRSEGFGRQWMSLVFSRPFSTSLVSGLEVTSGVLTWND